MIYQPKRQGESNQYLNYIYNISILYLITV